MDYRELCTYSNRVITVVSYLPKLELELNIVNKRRAVTSTKFTPPIKRFISPLKQRTLRVNILDTAHYS